MSWSPLSTEVHNTSQYSSRIAHPSMVVLHHGATTNAQWIIDVESSGSKQVSSHCVVKDDRIAGIVKEEFRAWSLSDALYDSRAFTVECANESTNGWTISPKSHESLARLVANWAARYGFFPHRDGDPKRWTVIGHREVYTIYGGSYATACPGGMDLNWIAHRAQEIMRAKPSGSTGTPIEEDDMFTDEDRARMLRIENELNNTKAGIWSGGSALIDGKVQKFKYGVLPIAVHNQTLIAQMSARIAALEAKTDKS